MTPRWVKVDSEITHGVAGDPQRRAILQLLSQVARDSRAGLIAEGIESGEDLDVCVEEGVFAAQGYFFWRGRLKNRRRRLRNFARGSTAGAGRCCRWRDRASPIESATLRSETALESVRLDVWLDVSCLFPTRSQAKAACEGGKVDVNGASAKSHREIRVGDRLTVTRGPGIRRELVVQGLADHSISKAQARMLYEDERPRRGRRWPKPAAWTDCWRRKRMRAVRTADRGERDGSRRAGSKSN